MTRRMVRLSRLRASLILPMLPLALLSPAGAQVSTPPNTLERQRIEVPSSIDRTLQPAYLSVPDGLKATDPPTPLVVVLHTWSFDLEQRDEGLEKEVADRRWMLLAPNFRGRNDHPEACGSNLAQQDILDAVQWVQDRYPIDRARVYLTGLSGGGYMTMLMAARHPEPWAAASAWVGISDLADWYRVHSGDDYGQMMRACLGGAPGDSDAITNEYKVRSPITFVGGGVKVPLDIAAGRDDPVVPIAQSLRVFSAIALAGGGTAVSEDDLRRAGRGPAAAPDVIDPDLGKKVYLRREAGASRITIFDGAHEWVPQAAIAWLAGHRKP